MAGGPIYPTSVDYGSSGDLFPNLYAGAGGNAAPNEWGHGVKASLGTNRTLSLRFPMPPGSLPSGTLKLRLIGLANATAGAAKFIVSDGTATPATSPAASGNPSAVTLTDENSSTPQTVTWSTSENDRYKEFKQSLTASPAANDILVVAVKFQTSGWTLAQVSTWIISVIWE